MASKKRVSKTRELIESEYEANELAQVKQNQSRARSFSVGKTSGGLLEINMRGDFYNLWYIMNPVEAVEVIEQIAASVGLEIAKRPKEDFSSWRSWDLNQPSFNEWKGAAPFQFTDQQRKQLKKLDDAKFSGHDMLPASVKVDSAPKPLPEQRPAPQDNREATVDRAPGVKRTTRRRTSRKKTED